MTPTAVPSRDTTVVAESTWVWVLVGTGFPAIGAGLGWLAARYAERLDEIPFMPFGFVWRWMRDAPQPGTTLAAVAVGVIAGLGLALLGWEERLTVEVSREGVTFRRGRSSRTIPGGDVAGGFLDRKEVVVLDRSGGEAARETSDLNEPALRAAFEAHGYRWHPDGDPHAAEFTRWVEGLPGLPDAADALLRARAKAVEKGDKSDQAELRTELARLGVVVRTDDKRQFVRVAKPRR